ncbi:hypothetical protein O6H91_14G069900 [Diphasiastrum complanatum]|uniref:Uncharacterized protein n=1 Tax=Diphasiastrum complanatum TaxID=34168 RepID=A0ACC2BQF3_DIPCM|nr:hypothetical protein O6H91_14G069900 [Diphasiastrum complanatum]
MEEKEDDEERRLLLRNILDLLLAGGYFRSRISSLSAFDKLTGGLAWCITASNADVDFDLFYDDDATLGLKMNFPFPKDNAERLQCTLLEYGHLGTRDLVQRVYDEQLALAEDDSLDKITHIFEKGAQSSTRLTQVLKPPGIHSSLSTFRMSADGPLSGSNVKRIVQLRSEEIQTITLQYSHNGETKGTHEREVAAIVKQIEWQEAQITKLQQNIARSQLTLENLKATILQKDEQRREMELETERLQDLLKENNTAQQFFSLLKHLQRLETEEMHLQEEDTKERAELEAHKQRLEEQSASSEDVEKLLEIDDAFKTHLQKWKTLRADLATKNRALLVLQRQLDDVPSQTELIQYEYRFVELYLHIQAKLRETRKYYSAYNALAESNEVSVKEISLLNSIQSQFEVAMATAEGQVKFVESMKGILKGVQQKLDKIGARYHHEQIALALLKEKYASAIASQRKYSALLKVFQDECAENENLRKALDALNSSLLESTSKA